MNLCVFLRAFLASTKEFIDFFRALYISGDVSRFSVHFFWKSCSELISANPQPHLWTKALLASYFENAKVWKWQKHWFFVHLLNIKTFKQRKIKNQYQTPCSLSLCFEWKIRKSWFSAHLVKVKTSHSIKITKKHQNVLILIGDVSGMCRDVTWQFWVIDRPYVF